MSDIAAAASAPAEKERVFLEADDEIRGQKYACLSFLTPSRGILRNKDLFFISKFLEFYAMDYKIRSTESFLLGQLRAVQTALSDVEILLSNSVSTEKTADLVEKITLARGALSRNVSADLETYVKENITDFKESAIVESYEKYMIVNRQRLEDEFHKANDFQTTLHGLKVRGVYSTSEQATARAKLLNKKDPYFNVYVADVGEWLPWDPNPEDVQESSYQNEELNKLMTAYKDNAAKRDAFFEEEKRQKIADAAQAAAVVPGSQGEYNKRKVAVFGESGKEQDAAETAAGVFADADLAIQRKQMGDTAQATASSGSTIELA